MGGARLLAIRRMHPQPCPAWYLHAVGDSAPARLLTDDGLPAPGVGAGPVRLLAELAAAIHAAAPELGERELRALEQCVALQRWRR